MVKGFEREIKRARRNRECTARGFHVRSGKSEIKTMGGKPYAMELCAYCEVWLEQNSSDWLED